MGLSWSSRRRHNRHHHHHHHHHHHQNPSLPQPTPSSSSSNPPPLDLLTPPPTQPPPPPPPTPPPPSYAFAANAPYPIPQHPPQNPYPSLPLPSPPPLPYSHHSNAYNYSNYTRPMTGQSNFHPFYSNQSNGWPGFHPPAVPSQPQPPPTPYVDHQSAKKIKNDVNVRKDTIRVELDEKNPNCHLVSFSFDAMVDGSITIFYFAKEGANCTFTPLYPEIYMPVRIPFQNGLAQKFCQPSGTGMDLGFFDMNDLSKPSPGDVFPLIISAESCLPSVAMNEQPNEPLVTTSLHAQVTQAVLEKNNEGHLQVRVIKQILWVDGVRYELREIYGISNSNESTINDNDSGKECVICMTEPKETAVLPCRHMCMCSVCAKALRLQSNKCPICRQPIQELLEIKVDEAQS
uniref:RING-type E3 ubiquitin transferase n=1 Tax=Davidia involucrata TaxID=16924 RepID=A0A5B7C3Q5_DAVIN